MRFPKNTELYAHNKLWKFKNDIGSFSHNLIVLEKCRHFT